MQTILVLRGLPASGKSSKAKLLLNNYNHSEQEYPWIRVNKDDLRGMLHNHVFSREKEDLTHSMSVKLVSMALSNGYNVIVDNTHITNDSVKPYHKLAEQIGNISVIEEWIKTPLDECLRRNALREGIERVPDEVIMKMAQKMGNNREDKITDYPAKTPAACLVQDEYLPSAVICDLDGTLAHMNGRNPYDASTCEEDLINEAVLTCITAMCACDRQIIFLSGRDSKYREQTKRFIEKHFTITCDIKLYMRPEGDTRKDSIVKRELFDEYIRDKYYIDFVLDDRNQVVDMWREMGLVCFQVAEGNF